MTAASTPGPFAASVRAALLARLEREPFGFRVESAELRRAITQAGRKCVTESVQRAGRDGIKDLAPGFVVRYAKGWFDVRVS